MAGTSSFALTRLFTPALDAITSFSTLPLRVWSLIGVFGEYIGRVFNEVKGRPVYIVAEENPPEAAPVVTPGPFAGPCPACCCPASAAAEPRMDTPGLSRELTPRPSRELTKAPESGFITV